MAGDLFDPRFEFQVPKFTGFPLGDEDDQEADLDKYFDFDHENGVPIDLGLEASAPAKITKSMSEGGTRASRLLRKTPSRQEAAKKCSLVPPCADKLVAKRAASSPACRDAATDEMPMQPKRCTRNQTKASASEAQRARVEMPPPHSESVMPEPNTPSNNCPSVSESTKKDSSQKVNRGKQPLRKGLVRSASLRTPKVQSSEEQELEMIRQLRAEVVRKRRLAQKSHSQALTVSASLPPRHRPDVTKPHEFTFATDKRIPEPKSGPSTAAEEKDFTSMLRHYEPLKTQHKGCTVPINTSLCTRKRKLPDEESQKPVAEAVALWSKTPERFHTQPRGTKFVPSSKRRRSRSLGCSVTVPVTPRLQCKDRARGIHVISQAEIDNKAAEQVSSYRFRARPVNAKIFEKDYIGVPVKEIKEPTVAVSPNFHGKRRLKEQGATNNDATPANSFHARPIPKSILDAPQGIKELVYKPVTVPKSPAFALKNRVRSMDSVSNEVPAAQADHIVRANPIPDPNKKFELKIEKSVVFVQPFSFDQRDQSIPLRKQQLIRDDELRMQKARQFRARNPDVLSKRAFFPRPSSDALTDITDHRLNTDLRSVDREMWEVEKTRAERLVAQLKAESELRREEEAKKEVERMRRDAVHKAQPVRHFKQTIVQKSTIPVTKPQSPCFSARLRTRAKNH